MAIDSSIWIYQFQATMRDKEGRVLINAHVLGFLRRITKLLFYGIKPVFVFDGGAPAIKRNTLVRLLCSPCWGWLLTNNNIFLQTQRKRKKTGAALTHAKLAERLLAARLRKEALERSHGISSVRVI
jgi:DNA excision repair protein ERCC-5